MSLSTIGLPVLGIVSTLVCGWIIYDFTQSKDSICKKTLFPFFVKYGGMIACPKDYIYQESIARMFFILFICFIWVLFPLAWLNNSYDLVQMLVEIFERESVIKMRNIIVPPLMGVIGTIGALFSIYLIIKSKDTFWGKVAFVGFVCHTWACLPLAWFQYTSGYWIFFLLPYMGAGLYGMTENYNPGRDDNQYYD